MRPWVAVLLAWLFLTMPALAENRLALVIGNDGYKNIGVLQKARADAKSYADLLRDKGYSVETYYDLGFSNMQGAVAQFVKKIQPGDTVVFVYSGHGWSDASTNYIVGVDAPDFVDQELLTRISLPIRNGITGVLDDFKRKQAGLKVAIIDACRDNPFHPPPNEKGYGLVRGVKPQSIEGSFVIYSAGEGQAALDRLSEADADPNSVFTRTLLPLLRADLPLTDAIKASQQKTHALADSTGHIQTPAYYDEVLGSACLSVECKSPAASAPSASDAALAAMIDAATSAELLASVIAKLPDGPLRERAKARAQAWKQMQVAHLTAEPPKLAIDEKAVSLEAAPDPALARMIDAATNADWLTPLIAGLPEGPLKERAKARAEALRKTQVAKLPPEPPKPAPTTASAERRYVLPEGAAVVPQLGHAGPVVAVSFSPDGRFIVSGGGDNTLKLWDAANGALLKTFAGHDGGVATSVEIGLRRFPAV